MDNAQKIPKLYLRSLHNSQASGTKLATKLGTEKQASTYAISLLLYAMQRTGVLPKNYEAELSTLVSNEMFKIINEITNETFICPEADELDEWLAKASAMTTEIFTEQELDNRGEK